MLSELFATSPILSLEPGAWRALLSAFDAEAHGPLTEAEIRIRLGALSSARPSARQPSADGAVAVIPVNGILTNRQSFLGALLGWSSATSIREEVRRAVADPHVKAIALLIDSPGGAVEGITETAAVVAAAARTKPVTAIADALAASAAYWIGVGASEFVTVPSGRTGGIGVFSVHDNLEGAAAQAGIKRTYVSAGRYKVDGHPFEPLSDTARAAIQRVVDVSYGHFVADVAAGRRVRPEQVRDGMGQGRALVAEDALTARLVDRIDTAENALERVVGRAARSAAPRASLTAADADLDRRRRRLRLAGR